MKNKAFEKFCDTAELPTISQFATKLACDAARERATFDAGFEAGRVDGQKLNNQTTASLERAEKWLKDYEAFEKRGNKEPFQIVRELLAIIRRDLS